MTILTHGASGGGDNASTIDSVVVTVTENAPAATLALTAHPGDRKVTLSWIRVNDASITKWQYRQKIGGGAYGSWLNIPHSAPPGYGQVTLNRTCSGLLSGTAPGCTGRKKAQEMTAVLQF